MSNIHCPNCGRPFEVKNYMFGIYCSTRCREEGKKTDAKPDKKCDTCGWLIARRCIVPRAIQFIDSECSGWKEKKDVVT